MAAERPDWEWYQRASEQVSAGDLEAAERIIAGALEAGHLWRVSLLAAPTLEALRGRNAFERVGAEARRRVEALGLRPLVLLASPANGTRVAPLVLALHGATGNAAAELDRWRPATDVGFIVAAGQSSQPATKDGFCWDPPRERVLDDLRAIAAELPPHARIVLAGFSQGAWVALNAALRGDLFQAGTVVMVAPFAGPTASLEPAWRRLKIAVLVGERDIYRTDVERLVKDLKERGHHVMFEVIRNLAHAYPADFTSRLPQLLSSVPQAIDTTSSSSSSQ